MNSSRSPYTIGVVVFVIAIALGIFALSRTGGGPPAAAPSQSPVPSPSVTEGVPTAAPDPEAVKADDGTTVVRFRVAGDCDGCLITGRASDAPEGQQNWSATVANGSASLELPTPNTYGLYFLLQGAKGEAKGSAQTLLILQPNGSAAGSAVSEKTVNAAGKGRYCWAGTTLDTADVAIATSGDPKKVTGAWADPAIPAVGPSIKVGQAAAVEDALTCT